jgi:carboxypeptidase T
MMPRLRTRTACAVFLVFALTLTLSGSVLGVTQPNNELGIVRIKFDSPAELEVLASRLDIWEVQHDAGLVVALVSSEETQWLTKAGYIITTHPASTQHLDTIPGYDCYRTIDEQYALLDSWTQLYSQLAQTFTLGHSYEGREIRVLQLTNVLADGIKPIFFLMANIHGRELITNETALDFAQFLLERYMIDPDVTWLLDRHVIYIMVSANPDGHVKNEPGEPWTWWRKNTHPYGNCADYSYGVDLNRNADFTWGGDSTNPCAETYQGPGPLSESESALIADFIRSLFPDRRGTGFQDPAPADTSGIFITLHSYGNLLLWPWSHTYAAAPNEVQLTMLGTKLASFNNYKAEAASGLYPASGTTLDFAYGELGVASFLFEIGSGENFFYPSCNSFAALIQPNIQAFLYAAKIARSPYEMAFGPDVVDVVLTPSSVTSGDSVVISATIDDTLNGNYPITAAELSVDNPPWDGGVTTVLTATDTTFDTSVENVYMVLNTNHLAQGKHLVFLRGKDTAGYWGPVSAAFLDIVSPTFQLEPQTIHGYAPPGHPVNYTFYLTNTSTIAQTYKVTGSLSLWETQFTPSSLSLLPMQQNALTVTVTIPILNALPQNQYTDQFTLTVAMSITPSLGHASYITTHVLRYSAYIPLLIREN